MCLDVKQLDVKNWNRDPKYMADWTIYFLFSQQTHNIFCLSKNMVKKRTQIYRLSEKWDLFKLKQSFRERSLFCFCEQDDGVSA